MAAVSFKSRDLGKSKIEKELKIAAEKVTLVGIPGSAKIPPSEGQSRSVENLAELAFILEKGSQVNNMPARPFMKQTRETNEKQFMGLVRNFYKAILNGKMGSLKALSRLGEAYEGAMKEIFIKGHFAPNAPITIHGGWMRNKVSGKVFKAEGKKSSTPLIDTGRLRQSIIYKIAKISSREAQR